MKVLITGANGLLGQELVHQLLEKKYQVVAAGKGAGRLPESLHKRVTYHPFDLTDPNNIYEVMDLERPDVVVHAAAITQVDDCEKNPELCEKVNVTGTAQILVDAEQFSSHFIYVSTDFVFEGTQVVYSETDDLNPVNFYGFTKMQAEAITQTSEIPWSIVRTSLVYGQVADGTRSNIISWVKNSLEKGQPIKVVADQWRTPTSVADLAKGIALIIEQKATGIFHLSGKDILTPYDLALQTARLFQLDERMIEKVDAATFSQPGRRPVRTALDISKARATLGYEPVSFADGLRQQFGR